MRGVILAIAIGAPTSALAFGTINHLGQHEEHARITREALRLEHFGPQTLASLSGGGGAFGAVGAPDKPGRGLIFSSSAHCDNGDEASAALVACRNFILASTARAVTAAGGLDKDDGASKRCIFNGREMTAKCRVLAELGLAFHASQDFYAHSNWVDRPLDDPIPGLGREGAAPWLFNADSPPPAGLITGCFKLVPERWYCRGRVKHADLNKDNGLIDFNKPRAMSGLTPRGGRSENFRRAVEAAVADTAQRWQGFQRDLVTAYGPVRGVRLACLARADDAAECPNA